MTTTATVDVQAVSELFRALADETRMGMVALLSHGELCVCHLVAALELPQSTASRHLGVLRSARVVQARRSGSWVYYSLAPQDHPLRQAQLDALVADYAGSEALASTVARVVKDCGPGACG